MAFFEFNIAMSGLFASQRGLSVTSNNITNANTKGYSRQVLGQQASTPLTGIGVGMLGTGVSTTGVKRIRDSYLDTKIWGQNDKLGEYKVKVEQSSLIESVYGEPSDAGFTKVFNGLFKAFDSLSNLPDEKERKSSLRQEIISYTKYFNNISQSLSNFQQDLNYDLKAKVDEINLLGNRIQSLNSQIYQAEIYGDDANSFRDERELCVDRLSELINVETKETQVLVDGKSYNQFSVKIAGQTLVDHLQVRELGIEVRGNKETQLNNLAAEVIEANKKIEALGLKKTDSLSGLVTVRDALIAEKDNLNKELEALKKDPTALPDQIAAKEKEIADKQKEIDEQNKLVEAVKLRDDKVQAMKNISSKVTVNMDSATDTFEITYTDAKNVLTLVGKDPRDLLEPSKVNAEDIDGLYDVVWKDGLSFDMTDNNMSGELKGVIDMRDGCGVNGNGTAYNGIPYYIKRMDEYVRQFATTMNEVYSTNSAGCVEMTYIDGAVTKEVYMKKDSDGKAKYYSDKEGKTEIVLSKEEEAKCQPKYQIFTYSNGGSKGDPVENADLSNGYSNMTSANFSISNEIYKDANNIRTNYEHYPEDGANPNPNNNDLMSQLAAQQSNKKMFNEGDPKDYMIAIFSELGINAQEATMYHKTQTSVVNNINNQRYAVSQVDTNEEFTNLIKFQQAYQASAKIINTIDGIYETTIFKLGNF